jgi:hypothetical protein
MDEDIIYFEKQHSLLKTIKNYIITQCSSGCREERHPETVRQDFSDFDFGYIRKSMRATTGIRNFRKTQKETVHSFVLCKYKRDTINNKNIIKILLLCSSKNNSYNNKDGVNLLKVVESKARKEKIENLRLFSLGKSELKRWYISQGFVLDDEIFLTGTKTVKVYLMSKKIIENS